MKALNMLLDCILKVLLPQVLNATSFGLKATMLPEKCLQRYKYKVFK